MGIRMKYTQYLINNNNLVDAPEPSHLLIISILQSTLELIRTVYMLGLCFVLFPFAVLIDLGRLTYCFQLKTSRRFKQIPLLYKVRKSSVSFLSMRNRFAYMFIQKSNNPVI
jgi:hypothetical protein